MSRFSGLAILAALMVSGCTASMIPTATPTVDPLRCEVEATEGQTQYPSPDGKLYATDWGVVSPARGECVIAALSVVPRFVGWTADSRYAVFRAGDQYGSAYTGVIDTKKWRRIDVSPTYGDKAGTCSRMSGACNFGAVALAPDNAWIVMEHGKLVSIPSLDERDLLATTGQDVIRAAAWSPDEARLALIAFRFDAAVQGIFDFVLYVADGDGSNVREVIALEINPQVGMALEWGADHGMLTVVNGDQRLVIDLAGAGIVVP